MNTDDHVRLAKFIENHPELDSYPRVLEFLNVHPDLVGFFEKHPSMIPVHEALVTSEEGGTITSCCPKCGALLTVQYSPLLHSAWVDCESGHRLYGIKYQRGKDPFQRRGVKSP